ncbi:MAG: sulfurtransferase complex subunit TusB [Nitrospinae bacterium]|nr:sulfurtransferase complex subunit TusB [Nitrospinota bacterium]
MLFTVNKSPLTSDNLKTCLRFAKKGNSVLLYEDGVYGAIPGTKVESVVKEALKSIEVFALKEDLKARGFGEVIDGVKLVDYAGFVGLVEEHNVCPWL